MEKKTYNNGNKMYEVFLENGQETIRSLNKPGEGWVRSTPEITQLHAEMQQGSRQNIKSLAALLKDIKQ